MQLGLPGRCCNQNVHIVESAAASCQQGCSLSCFFGPLAKSCHGCIGQLSFTIAWVPAARKADRSFQLLPQKASRGKEIVSKLEEGAETEQPSSNDSSNNNSNYQPSPFYEFRFYWCWQAMSAERRGALALAHVWSLSSHVWLRPWDSLGKNPGVGCHVLLQGIFSTQGSDLQLTSPALAGRFFTTSTAWEALALWTQLLLSRIQLSPI